jgi:uncharacterized protein YjbJ (UPF0337 family)
MNKEQVTGKVDELKGRVKQSVGEATGNQQLANEGTADQIKGAAKQTWGNVKETANESVNLHKDEAAQHAADTRAKLRDGANEIKEKIDAKLDTIKENQQHRRDRTA